MYTDGYIVDEKRFGIDLTDEDCIAYISKETGHNYKKYEQKDVCIFNNEYISKKKTKFRIIFSSLKNCKQLEKYGLINNKTYALNGFNFKDVDEQYYPFVLRGIIDGDGWITSIGNGLGTFGVVTASEKFVKWINELCIKIGMDELNIKEYIPKNGKVNLYKITTAKTKNMKILHDIVYKDELGMNRKRDKLRKMLRDYNKDIE